VQAIKVEFDPFLKCGILARLSEAAAASAARTNCWPSDRKRRGAALSLLSRAAAGCAEAEQGQARQSQAGRLRYRYRYGGVAHQIGFAGRGEIP